MNKIDLTLYQDALAHIKYLNNTISKASETNKLKQECIDNYSILNTDWQELKQKKDKFTLYLKGTLIEMGKFRDECLPNLEERVESILNLIMPEENFKVQITFKQHRGKYFSELYLGKETSNGIYWQLPRAQNGEFIKQLVSFSLIVSLNLLLGSKFVMIDEPFSSSDTVNVNKIQDVLKMMNSADIQIIMIEHKEELYNNLTHQEILLKKHRSTDALKSGFVEIVSSGKRIFDAQERDSLE